MEHSRNTRIVSRRVESTSPLRLAAASNVAFALPFGLDSASFLLLSAVAVVPGGRRVLVVQPDERAPKDATSLTVVANWPEEVKAKLRGGQQRGGAAGMTLGRASSPRASGGPVVDYLAMKHLATGFGAFHAR